MMTKLTAKDGKYSCAIGDQIISERQETNEWYESYADFAMLWKQP